MVDVKTKPKKASKKGKVKAKATKATKKALKVSVPKIPKLKSKHAKMLEGIGPEMISIVNDANAEANRTVIVSRLWALARLISEAATSIAASK